MAGQWTKWLVVGTLVMAMGGHWFVLQSVAWMSMAAQYSKALPITEVLKKTFDGQNPCDICKFVAEGKKAEQERDPQKIVTKFDLLFQRNPVVLYPPFDFDLLPILLDSAEPRWEPPASPPPRFS